MSCLSNRVASSSIQYFQEGSCEINNCGCGKGVSEKAYIQALHFVLPGSVGGILTIICNQKQLFCWYFVMTHGNIYHLVLQQFNFGLAAKYCSF